MPYYGFKIRRVIVQSGNVGVFAKTEEAAIRDLRNGGYDDFDQQGEELVMLEIIEHQGDVEEDEP